MHTRVAMSRSTLDKAAAIKRAVSYYQAIVYPANEKDFDARNPLPRAALLAELQLINTRFPDIEAANGRD